MSPSEATLTRYQDNNHDIVMMFMSDDQNNEKVSSHILDTTLGKPAAGVILTLSRLVSFFILVKLVCGRQSVL